MGKVKLYTLYESKNAQKKFDVYVENPKTGRIKKVSFGAAGMSDYTIHKDKDRRERYWERHKKDKIFDVTSPGFWSWWILWGVSTSKNKCLAYTKKKFGLKVRTVEI